MAENRENKLKYCKVSNSNNQMLKNKLIRGDGDLYILQVAQEINGIVLSNDQYQQYWNNQPIYWQIIDKRLYVPILAVLIVE